MNYILSSLFSTTDEFASYVAYVEGNITFKSLDSSARKAVKKIKIILTSSIYTMIQNLAEGTETEKKEALRAAVANLTMAEQSPYDVISRRKQEIETYKYEMEGMIRGFRQAYYDAMDSLISLLSAEQNEEWLATPYNQMLQTLEIKKTEEFDAIYPIDLSYLFFFRCIPWQKEVMSERLEGFFGRAEGNESAIALLKRALVKLTLSKALRRFDILEFPAIIRGLFTDSKVNRNSESEQTQILRLSDQLQAEADMHISTVETMLTDHTVDNAIADMPSNPNAKAYMIF
jgi:hypothetical protein